MNRLLFLLSLMVIMAACDSEGTKEKSLSNAEKTPTTTAPAQTEVAAQTATPTEAATPELPSLPMEKAKNIWDNCDYVDYVFYELPYSMSLDNKSSVQSVIRHISASPVPELKPACKSVGRIFYQVKGENVLSAEFYFSHDHGCYYLVFIEDNKPTYANLLTKEAVEYFNKAFSSVQTQPTKQ